MLSEHELGNRAGVRAAAFLQARPQGFVFGVVMIVYYSGEEFDVIGNELPPFLVVRGHAANERR
jgi:hypothetical protein